MEINLENRFIKKFMSYINHYDHEKYWKRRQLVVDPKSKIPNILRLYYLYYIKKVDSFWKCSFGTSCKTGSQFATPPVLWHGLNGIIIGYNVKVGCNCIVC